MISFEEFVMEAGSPIYQQILLYIKRGVVAGTVMDGDELPSRRVLSALLGVNPNTVQKALTYLEEEGILFSRGTVGRFVTSDETVLQQARERVRREAVRGWLAEASALGITTDELIAYIKEETT